MLTPSPGVTGKRFCFSKDNHQKHSLPTASGTKPCSSSEEGLYAGRVGNIPGSRTTPHSFPSETCMKCCILDRHLLLFKLTLAKREREKKLINIPNLLKYSNVQRKEKRNAKRDKRGKRECFQIKWEMKERTNKTEMVNKSLPQTHSCTGAFCTRGQIL